MFYKNNILFFKNFVTLLISVYLAVLLILFTIKQGSALFDVTTLLYVFGIAGTLILFFAIERNDLSAQSGLLSLFFLFFVFPRTLQYLCLPEQVTFPFEKKLQIDQINTGLLYVFLGLISFVLGFISSDKIIRKVLACLKFKRRKEIIIFSSEAIALLLIFSILFLFCTFFVFDVSPFGQLRFNKFNSLFQFFLLIFNIDVIFFILLIISFLDLETRKKKINQIIMLLATTAYLITGCLTGSRGMPIRVFLNAIFFYLCVFRNFKINFLKAFLFVLFLIVSGLISYPIANHVRLNKAARVEEKVVQIHEAKDFLNTKQNNIYPVLDRFGVVDYALISVSMQADEKAKKKFLNLSYIMKKIINFCVPGDVFPEAKINTSRLVPVLFEQVEESHVVQRNEEGRGYFSSFYTAWGVAFLLFGWTGGLVFLFFMVFILHCLYLLILHFSDLFCYYIGPMFLIFIFSFYASMGLDQTFELGIVLLMSTLFTLCYAWVTRGLFGYSLKIKEIDFGSEKY